MKKTTNLGVILFRLFVPLSLLWNPFWGGIASIIVDSLDVILIDLLHHKKFTNYTLMDKTLDTYYLSLELLIALTWQDNFAKYLALFLFLHRFVGYLLVMFTHKRIFLVLFPNIFEYHFLIYVYFLQFQKLKLSSLEQLKFLALIIPLKLAHEYILHYKKLKPWEKIKHFYFAINGKR